MSDDNIDDLARVQPPAPADLVRINRLHEQWRWARTHAAITVGTDWASQFRQFGQNSKIEYPFGQIVGERQIEIGDPVRIGELTTLVAFPQHETDHDRTLIRIHDRVLLGRMNQLLASASIEIESDTGTSPGVIFVDATHRHDIPNVPVGYQGMLEPRPIHIGRGCLIQSGAVILGGVTLGDFTTVAAHSVVVGRQAPYPSNCVLAGVPARVARRHDDPK